MVLPQA
jgi:hypothetical protein